MEFIPRVQKSVLGGVAPPAPKKAQPSVPVAVPVAVHDSLPGSGSLQELVLAMEKRLDEMALRITDLESKVVIMEYHQMVDIDKHDAAQLFAENDAADIKEEDAAAAVDAAGTEVDDDGSVDPEAIAKLDLHNMTRPQLLELALRLNVKPVTNNTKLIKAIRKAMVE